MGVIVRSGIENIGNIYLQNQTPNSNLYLGLFLNNFDPALDMTNLILTNLIEPTAIDYIRITLTPSNWVVVGNQYSYPQVVFTVQLGSFGNVYGSFIATSSDNSGKLIAIANFTTYYSLSAYGDNVSITPIILKT